MEAIQGSAQVILFRLKSESTDAAKIALQTSHDVSMTRDVSSESTKDGNSTTSGQLEEEISNTFQLAKGDDSYDKLKTAIREDELVAVWDVDSTEENKNEEGKYKATYYEAKVSDLTKTAETDASVEVEVTYTVVGGIGQDGYTALNESQEDVVQFVFQEAVANAGV